MELDLNDVIGTRVTQEGVAPVTKGAVISARLRDSLRSLLKLADPEGYEQYRKVRYPSGASSATETTKRESVRYLFARAGELAVQHYLSTAQE